MRYRFITTLLLALVLAVLYLLGDDADTGHNTDPVGSPVADPDHAGQMFRNLVIP